MKNKFMETYCMIALLVAGIFIGSLLAIHCEVPDQGVFNFESFTFQDFQLYPPTIKGFRIQEWPEAVFAAEDPTSVWEVQILIENVGYTRGPVYDSKDKAMRVMIYLAKECGI